MSDYTIAAIPTVYRGRRYRSRLEARWAAFFDLLGWQYEYEPFDLGRWSPDFLLPLCREWAPVDRMLVEVKPFIPFVGTGPFKTVEKMLAAVNERGITKQTHFLLLGTGPVQDPQSQEFLTLGCLGHPTDRRIMWNSALISWWVDPVEPRVVPDIMASELVFGDMPPFGSMSGLNLRNAMAHPYVEHTRALWAMATNAVQWRPEERR